MSPGKNLHDLVTSAYQALYDVVQLRSHPLAAMVLDDKHLNEKELGWQLHNLLLGFIEELNPGPKAPPYSKEWRRHRLMVMRYVDGQDPHQIAEQLAISRRQFFREQALAIQAVVAILSERFKLSPSLAEPALDPTDPMLQAEVSLINRYEHTARLDEVIAGVWEVLEDVIAVHGVTVEAAVSSSLPDVLVSRSILRQVILGVIGKLITEGNSTRLRLSAHPAKSSILLTLEVESPRGSGEPVIQEYLQPYIEMLAASNAQIEIDDGGTLPRFCFMLPTEYQDSVLVIDDNPDMLELYTRYLTPNHFQVFGAQNAAAALELAHEVRPSVIILDLMMPETDGWEIFKLLRTQSDVSLIPIIVCSVLKQRELALALGAKVFLKKPITETILLDAIRNLTTTARSGNDDAER